MRFHWKAALCFIGASLFVLAPATAGAEVTYFLVGVRHVYRIGPARDAHLAEREEIEKNYADGVAQDQDTFNQHVANGADKDKESEQMNSDLDALADARDKSLGSIFEQCDQMRDDHPELRIEGDGPYQVIGVDMHTEGNTEVIDRYAAYAPWPGYVVEGPCYGGWDWGVWYTPGVFIDLYWGWFDVWPGGRFWGGFWGHHGPFVWAPHGFNDRWHGGFGRGGFGRSGLSRSSGWSGYSHSGSSFGRGGSLNNARSSGYTHSSADFAHSSASSTRSSGYTHSSSSYRSSATRSGSHGSSSYNHGWSGGSSHASNSSGFGHAGTSRSYTRSADSGSRGGSYGHSSYGGSSRSSSSRSSGSGRGGSGSGSHGRGR